LCTARTGQCDNLSDADVKSETKPIVQLPGDKGVLLEGEFGVYGYVGLDVGSPIGQAVRATKPISILEAFLGVRQDLKFASKYDQASDPTYTSNYGLKIYGELGFGSSVRDALKKVIGTNFTFKPAVVFEYPIHRSPIGKNNVDQSEIKVAESVKFIIALDPKYLDYVGIGYNVERIEIYRVPPNGTEIESMPIGTVTASGGQSEFTWNWTPTNSDVGKNAFYAFVVTKPTDVPLEITEDSRLEVEVKKAGQSPGNFKSTISYAKVGSREAYDIQFSGSATLVYKDNLIGKGYDISDGIISVTAYTTTRTGGQPTASGEFHYTEVCQIAAATYKVRFTTPGDRQLSYTVSFGLTGNPNRQPNTTCTQTYDNGVVKTRFEFRDETLTVVGTENNSYPLKVYPILEPGHLVGQESHIVQFEGSGDVVTYNTSWDFQK
jgi:hypothetical protein